MTAQRPGHNPARPTGPETDAGTATELQRLREENAQLHQALESRPVIDQARGMIMAVGRCTPAQAGEVPCWPSPSTTTSSFVPSPSSWWPRPPADPLSAPIRRALGQVLRAHRHV
ncbi:ANTAR domain-containing protein [Streptomyces tricolor]|uniref:ANTAR domain-containing protein n=1 Tax=Streptomyces tricolor TaxID=68277 RepID=UPI00380D8A04